MEKTKTALWRMRIKAHQRVTILYYSTIPNPCMKADASNTAREARTKIGYQAAQIGVAKPHSE